MYGFLLRPKWIGFHLLVAFGIVGMIVAGFWQLDRLDQRREFNATVVARSDLPDAPVVDLVASAEPDLEPLAWRAATATGTYLPEDEFLVVNRSQNGRAGDNVVTPMLLDDGRVLVVNRGFVPLGIEVPDAPSGLVEVRGIVRTSEQRRTGQLSDPAQGRLTEVQRIDLDRLADQLPATAVPVYLDLIASQPPEPPGFPEPVIRPDLSEGSHLSYAVQWFIFAAAAALGWVLAVRRSVSRRRLDVTRATAPRDDEDRPSSDVTGSATVPTGTPVP